MLVQALDRLRVRLKVQEELNGVLVGFELLLIQMSVGLCVCLPRLQDPY